MDCSSVSQKRKALIKLTPKPKESKTIKTDITSLDTTSSTSSVSTSSVSTSSSSSSPVGSANNQQEQETLTIQDSKRFCALPLAIMEQIPFVSTLLENGHNKTDPIHLPKWSGLVEQIESYVNTGQWLNPYLRSTPQLVFDGTVIHPDNAMSTLWNYFMLESKWQEKQNFIVEEDEDDDQEVEEVEEDFPPEEDEDPEGVHDPFGDSDYMPSRPLSNFQRRRQKRLGLL